MTCVFWTAVCFYMALGEAVLDRVPSQPLPVWSRSRATALRVRPRVLPAGGIMIVSV
jgi:hypothetical protein